MSFFSNNFPIKKQLLYGLGITCLALLLGFILVKSKPRAKKDDEVAQAPLVRAIPLKKADLKLSIKANGKIMPAKSITLRSEVSGLVIFQSPNFKKGGRVKKGEVLLKIDPTDYESNLAQKKSFLSQAKLNLTIERAKSEVAEKEYERLKEKDEIDAEGKELFYRKPFLDKAQKEYDAALAESNRAQSLLNKTLIKAPVDAMVASVLANEHEVISPQGSIGSLISTEEYWAEVGVSLNDISHIDLPSEDQTGASATITLVSRLKTPVTKIGKVLRVAPELAPLGHMAQVIISVQDTQSLMPGALITAEIEGNTIESVYEIPREALIENDTVFTVDNQNKINKNNLEIIRREKDMVYVKGNFASTDRLVVGQGLVISEGNTVRIAQN